jgi:hypothetical protein
MSIVAVGRRKDFRRGEVEGLAEAGVVGVQEVGADEGVREGRYLLERAMAEQRM